jgi:hypothetical protein
MAVYRLGRAAVREWTHLLLTVASALAIGLTPLGIVPTLLPAGAAGIALYGSRAHLGHRRRAGDHDAVRCHSGGIAWWAIPAVTGTSVGDPRSDRGPSLWEMVYS